MLFLSRMIANNPTSYFFILKPQKIKPMFLKHRLLPCAAAIILLTITSCKKDLAEPGTVPVTADTDRKNQPDAYSRGVCIAGLPVNNLGFTIMSFGDVTTDVPAAITGNVSMDGSSAALNLVSCGDVAGTIYEKRDTDLPACAIGNDPNLSETEEDLLASFSSGFNFPCQHADEMYGGILNNSILNPGYYKWSTDLELSGTITLQGNENSTFLFATTGNLSVAPNTIFQFTGGAQATRVYWISGGSTTLGAGSSISGAFVSNTSMDVQSGAVVTGRLFARNNIALHGNSISPAAEVEP